jgi:hypothetical protein
MAQKPTHDPCPHCGLNRLLVGYRHNCPPHLVAALKAQRQAQAASTDLANDMANDLSEPATHLANNAKAPGRNRASPTYRYRNPDKRRIYQRDLMRQRRATGRAA